MQPIKCQPTMWNNNKLLSIEKNALENYEDGIQYSKEGKTGEENSQAQNSCFFNISPRNWSLAWNANV